jgi:glycosyltransferase involved in cell wall biosynthesis
MKIAILIARLPPTYLGGAEIAAYNIAKQLSKRGHEVHVVAILDHNLPKESTQNGFCVHRVKTVEIPLLRNTIYGIKSLFVVKKIKPDIVHSQSTSVHNAGLPAFLIKKILKLPYVVWDQGSEDLSRLGKPFRKTIIKNSDAAIALTNDTKRAMQKICDMPISVIPNGVEFNKFENLSRHDLRNKLKIKKDEKVIIFVGRLHPIKGLPYLIEAMKIIYQKCPKSKLLIVGDGEEKNNLENLVKKLNLNVCATFIGMVPNETVPEYMVASDVFVLPSLSEGFPVVILEAMASALPIVTTKVRGLPEIIKNGVNGILVEPRNSEEIAEKVLLLLNNNELRQRISEKNKEKVKKYGWEDVAGKLEEIYFGVVSDHEN